MHCSNCGQDPIDRDKCFFCGARVSLYSTIHYPEPPKPIKKPMKVLDYMQEYFPHLVQNTPPYQKILMDKVVEDIRAGKLQIKPKPFVAHTSYEDFLDGEDEELRDHIKSEIQDYYTMTYRLAPYGTALWVDEQTEMTREDWDKMRAFIDKQIFGRMSWLSHPTYEVTEVDDDPSM